MLSEILDEASVTDEQRVAVARAVGSIGSDYEQRKVLTAVLAKPPLSEIHGRRGHFSSGIDQLCV